MEKFLDRHKLLTWTEEEIENMNTPKKGKRLVKVK